ncbi:MAG: hypothetical protein V7606_993 [Burkholderiales bacterium]
MALATRCPHCKTTFRVANDQLKLRAGLVRCGACKEIFNGIEHLLRPDALEKPTAPAPVAETPAPPKETTGPAGPTEESRDLASFLTPRPAAEAKDAEPATADTEERQPPTPPDPTPMSPVNDPLQRMTLMDFSYVDDESAEEGAAPAKRQPQPEPDPNEPDPLEEAIEALQRKPLRGAKKSSKYKSARSAVDDELDEPTFVTQGRRRESMGRTLQAGMAIGTAVLLVTLFLQSTYAFRTQLAVWFPKAKPALDRTCAILHCQVGLPAQIESVSIESSELQAVAPEKNAFSLTFLLRNHSATAQSWPNLELTLNDANEKPIARRVFTPADYLGTQQDLTGFAAKSEQSFKLFFELSEIKASGYRVYLFYP